MSKYKPFDKIEMIRKTTGFSASQKLLMLIIASHLGKNDFCFLSLSTLEKECGLSRSTISDNLRLLISAELVWKLFPSDGFNSNRYGINFEKLVVLHYQVSSVTLLGWSPQTTRGVVSHYPKRKLNKSKEIKEELSVKIEAEKSRAKIRKTVGLKDKWN